VTPPWNVLFVTADQWRGECCSAFGHPAVRTPTLDQLAATGVAFRRHFAQAAPCGPSRASLYTGCYLMNHRSVLNGTPLDARFTNVALEARALGYEPALFGYTDTSVDPRTVEPGDPRLSRYEGVLPGFDPVCHLPESEPFAWLDWLRGHGYDVPEDWRTFVDRPAPGTARRTQYRAEHSQTAFLVEQFLAWAGDQGDRPWFAHVSFLRPHPPFLAPAPYDTMVDPRSVPAPVRALTKAAEAAQHPLLGVMIDHPFLAAPAGEEELRELRATYFGMMAEVDAQLGRLLAALDASGTRDRTIVVFTSDHGELLGDHYLLHKLGWFDAAYHVPLIVHDPRPSADATRGEEVEVFTEHVDVLPTLCDLLGAEFPLQCDGRPLTPWITGDTDGRDHWRDEVHYEFDFRDPDSPLLEDAFGVTMEECSLAVLRDDHGKYVQFAGHHAFPPIFFDLDTDPEQVVDRAADPAYAPRVLDYAQRMLAWRMRHADRTLSGTKLTMHAGPVTRRAVRR
jgi:arylsulfatase A-like enzyme